MNITRTHTMKKEEEVIIPIRNPNDYENDALAFLKKFYETIDPKIEQLIYPKINSEMFLHEYHKEQLKVIDNLIVLNKDNS